jgi:hypothetical protein
MRDDRQGIPQWALESVPSDHHIILFKAASPFDDYYSQIPIPSFNHSILKLIWFQCSYYSSMLYCSTVRRSFRDSTHNLFVSRASWSYYYHSNLNRETTSPARLDSSHKAPWSFAGNLKSLNLKFSKSLSSLDLWIRTHFLKYCWEFYVLMHYITPSAVVFELKLVLRYFAWK